MTSEDFVEWVMIIQGRYNWNRAELAEKMGMSATQVTRVLNREQLPGIDFCVGIGKAFDLPLETVFRRAGILPKNGDVDEITKAIIYESELAPIDDREEILEFAKMKRNIRERRESYNADKDREG